MRTRKNCGRLLALCAACCLLSAKGLQRVSMRQDEASLQDLIHACSKMMTPLGQTELDSPGELVWQLLSLTDHIFVLAKGDCVIGAPSMHRAKVTCVHGEVIDMCAPAKFFYGPHSHAMRVTFSHAVILQVAKEKQYRNVAIVEDDLTFINRRMSTDVVREFNKLLASSSWSLIRFGFRPYFLQHDAETHCPAKCRCTFGAFGEHFCQMNRRGCDLRSSDLYIVHSRHFALLQSMLLDLRVSNSKRIIDLHPMRSFENQWLVIPQISFQSTLDVPTDYQLGSGALYIKKCVGPRPLPSELLESALF